MNIVIPSILRGHEPNLRQFFEGMVFKLAVNAFKDQITDRDVPKLIDLMLGELQEFKDEFEPGVPVSSNALSETFDGANFWFLLFDFLRKTGVPDERELFIREFMDIDVVEGKVFAKKNRSGSRYREGDEITGTNRNGRCYIRTQHALSGASVSLPRDNIVWWGATGEWPTGELTHKNGNNSDDRIANLRHDVEATNDKDFPFVVQWKPVGKENHSHYGKWCYQRRHNLILIKVGYWDTKEEAAHEGIKAWKEKCRV